MNEDVKDMWVAALRSGEFKQGKYKLRNSETDAMCCLGVLSELAVRAGVITAEKGERIWRYDGHTLDPSHNVMEWAGIRTTSAVYGPSSDDNLMHLNDTAGYSFAQIADVIEREGQNL